MLLSYLLARARIKKKCRQTHIQFPLLNILYKVCQIEYCFRGETKSLKLFIWNIIKVKCSLLSTSTLCIHNIIDLQMNNYIRPTHAPVREWPTIRHYFRKFFVRRCLLPRNDLNGNSSRCTELFRGLLTWEIIGNRIKYGK